MFKGTIKKIISGLLKDAMQELKEGKVSMEIELQNPHRLPRGQEELVIRARFTKKLG